LSQQNNRVAHYPDHGTLPADYRGALERVQRGCGICYSNTTALRYGRFHNFVGAAAPTVGYVAPPDYLAAA
jgi:hypothetical protein